MELSLDARSLPRRPSNASLLPAPLVRTPSEGAAARTYLWRSSCLEMDSRALLFFSQLVISLLVLIFCIYEIAVLDDAQWAKMTGTLLLASGYLRLGRINELDYVCMLAVTAA